MVRFFTWYDISKIFGEKREEWPDCWSDVRVYNDSVVIYYCGCSQENARQKSVPWLRDCFKKNYDETDQYIEVDFTRERLEILWEEEETSGRKAVFSPLFQETGRMDPAKEGTLPGARILAFHSYKGGVGRTLSLLSLLRECSIQYPDKKILVIDADVEAPGLTWLMEGKGAAEISYLDVLDLMQFENVSDDMIGKMAELAESFTMEISTDRGRKEHFFIPVYRDKKRVMGHFSTPEKILLTQENPFFVTDVLSKLGGALGAELILIDLRTGITEYSAPFLLDPRVEKYYVTSTSLQSIRGMNQILEQVCERTGESLSHSRILLTMIPSVMTEEQIGEIEDRLLESVERTEEGQSGVISETVLRKDYIVEIPFEESLIHLDDFASICGLLPGKQLTASMGKLASELFLGEKKGWHFAEEETREYLKKLFEISRDEVTAEGNSQANMLVTDSIREMGKSFRRTLPRIVVGGAKGAGKTYIFKQLLECGTWEQFKRLTGANGGEDADDGIVIPLLSTLNNRQFREGIRNCERRIETRLGLRARSGFTDANFMDSRRILEERKNFSSMQWLDWWKGLLQNFADPAFESLEQLDEFLESKQERVLFIADGLEDLFKDSQSEKDGNWKEAVKALCQFLINEIDNLKHGNIGLMIFARKDLLSDAIETNYEQFRNLYIRFELNWNQTEALRLALWLAAKACPKLASGIDVTSAPRDSLVERLTGLWGIKLGKPDSKEAYSDRWILAALSDFTGQLQARDIVRFLKYSTESWNRAKITLHDRLIMPAEVKAAIEPCSSEKLDEMKAEMKGIYEILQKVQEMNVKKSLPMTADQILLTGDEISRLEEQGYLKVSDKKYYLPEIIRQALGFRYERGARPKVLSLLVQ